MASRPQPSSSLTQDAYEQIRADLLACRVAPGARLKINELCDSLSVSLSAVREALSRLTSEGLVIAEPQRGFRVAPISAAELRDLTAVRIQIEQACLRGAIEKGDIAWEAQVVSTYHSLSRTPMRDPDDPQRMGQAWSLAHAVFHEALVFACSSPWLLRLRAMLYAQSERYRRLSMPPAEVERDIGAEHQSLMEATLARDAPRAVDLMGEHLDLTTQKLLGQAWLTLAGTTQNIETSQKRPRGRPASTPQTWS